MDLPERFRLELLPRYGTSSAFCARYGLDPRIFSRWRRGLLLNLKSEAAVRLALERINDELPYESSLDENHNFKTTNTNNGKRKKIRSFLGGIFKLEEGNPPGDW